MEGEAHQGQRPGGFHIPPSDRKEMGIGARRQWYFTATMRIPDVKHKVRIVMIWRSSNDVEPCKILVT
jgi:hypothetical protein